MTSCVIRCASRLLLVCSNRIRQLHRTVYFTLFILAYVISFYCLMETFINPSWRDYLCNGYTRQNCTTFVDKNSVASNGVVNRSSTGNTHEFTNPKHYSYFNTKDEDRVNNSQQVPIVKPTVPLELLEPKKNDVNPETNNTCSSFPDASVLKINNNYWQKFQSSNGTFYLYGAYHDNRTAAQKPSIRILGMIDRIEPKIKANCLLWYDITKDPIVMPIIEYKYIWNRGWGNYENGILQPYLITCELPTNLSEKGFKIDQVPISVSLTEKGCEPATNSLRINNNVPVQKEKVAVCVKGLDFPDDDLSIRLVEWIEMLDLLGAAKIFFYEMGIHPNVSKVLRYYQEKGKIELTPITLPGDQPNDPRLRNKYLKSKIVNKRQNELIPYNDCYYRNLYNYDYLALLDIDEIIVPRTVKTWNDLINTMLLESKAANFTVRGSYNFRNVYFWDDEEHSKELATDIPHHMHMLQHLYRSYNHTESDFYVKSFHDTQNALILHNHRPFDCLGGACQSYPVRPETAIMHHYRADCVAPLKQLCETDYKRHVVKDNYLWLYKEELIPRVNKVLGTLALI